MPWDWAHYSLWLILQATFKITLDVPSDLVALSNMPIAEEKIDRNIKTVSYQESPIMSTYLVAVVVGLFDYVEDHTPDGKIMFAMHILGIDVIISTDFRFSYLNSTSLQGSKSECIVKLVRQTRGNLHLMLLSKLWDYTRSKYGPITIPFFTGRKFLIKNYGLHLCPIPFH